MSRRICETWEAPAPAPELIREFSRDGSYQGTASAVPRAVGYNPRDAMEQISKAIGRAKLLEIPSGLRIVLRPKWNWYTFFAAPVLASLVFIIASQDGLLSSKSTAAIMYLLVVVTAFRPWLWNIAGVEEVTITKDRLTIWYGIFGIGWPTHYRLKDASNFRYVAPFRGYRVSENRTVAFDYEFLPRRFGLYLTESEADQLIKVICSQSENAPSQSRMAPQRFSEPPV